MNGYSTRPASADAIRDLPDRIRTGRGAALQTPPLPSSPIPGTGDAGWLSGPVEAPCGWAWIRRQTGGRARIAIDAFEPDLEGAFTPLLDACRTQAAEWDCTRIVACIPEDEGPLGGAYASAGFSPAGSVCELRMELLGDLPSDIPPAGYFLKPYHELRHLPTLAALLHRAYHDRFSRPEFETDGVTVDTVRAEMEADPGGPFERDTYLLFNTFGKGVAVIRCRGRHWIDGPGVVPEERENGLHLALLGAALRHLRSTGSDLVWLVAHDDDPAWIEDYRAAGFKLRTNKTCWQKEIQ